MSYWFDREPTPAIARSRLLKTLIEGLAAGHRVSSHSRMGATMKVILRGLEERSVPYRIDAYEGGYTITSYPEGAGDGEPREAPLGTAEDCDKR